MFILLFIIMVLLLTIFIYVDIVPYFKRKVRKLVFFQGNYELYVSNVIKASLDMYNTNEPEMILNDNKDFITQFSILISRLKSPNNEWNYNFPKAFLILGLFDYYECKNFETIIKISDFYIDKYYKKELKFDCIMRIPYALFFLKVYSKTKDKKLLRVIHEAYSNILEWRSDNNIIYYFRKGKHLHSNLHYVDGLGMYIPFLVEYYKVFNENKAIEIAKYNMDYYINYGTDRNCLPFHNINNNINLGPNNWGRGVSWFILGLMPLFEIDEKYIDFGNKLLCTLEKIKNEKFVWSQFPGASFRIDSSVTVPILLLYFKLGKISDKKDIDYLKNILFKLTLRNGKIYYNSGDTRDINTYSKEFSTSEFTQGILLSLLSIIENNQKNIL